MNDYYAKADALLKRIAEEFGLKIEFDKIFNVDGYWAFWPCKLDETKWPRGMLRFGPSKIRVDYRGPNFCFRLRDQIFYIGEKEEAEPLEVSNWFEPPY